MNFNCIEVSNYTGFSDMLIGRVKTLHPKIHAGILNIRNNTTHRSELKKKKYTRNRFSNCRPLSIWKTT